MTVNINGSTKVIGFFGSTYKTSKMYALYNTAFKTLGLNYVYVPLAVSDLKKATLGIRHLGIKAVGVTIPYKIEIMKFLDKVDKRAKRIGAVNVVVNENRRLTGGNTDGQGAVTALKEKTVVKNKKIIILGAGGAARALAFTVFDEGAEVIILNRTKNKAKELAEAVGCKYDTWDKINTIISKTDIIINATSVGMAPNDNINLIDKELIHPGLVVFDIVPKERETRLIKDAKNSGCKIVTGNRMLLWQAVLKFKIYTGQKAPIDVMEKAFKNC